MAEIRRGPIQYLIEVRSREQRGRTAGMLRDFVRALDEAGIPDDAEWRADLRYADSRYSLSLLHTVRVNEPPADPEPAPQPWQSREEEQAAYDKAVVDAAGYINHGDADPVDDDGPSNG